MNISKCQNINSNSNKCCNLKLDYPLIDKEIKKIQTLQDTNTFQHNRTPIEERNPYGNQKPKFTGLDEEREALIKKIDSGTYSRQDLERCSRLSYLKHIKKHYKCHICC